MADELKTATNWAKELGVPEKAFKDAIKKGDIAPDSKKGACGYYTRKTAEKVKKSIK